MKKCCDCKRTVSAEEIRRQCQANKMEFAMVLINGKNKLICITCLGKRQAAVTKAAEEMFKSWSAKVKFPRHSLIMDEAVCIVHIMPNDNLALYMADVRKALDILMKRGAYQGLSGHNGDLEFDVPVGKKLLSINLSI